MKLLMGLSIGRLYGLPSKYRITVTSHYSNSNGPYTAEPGLGKGEMTLLLVLHMLCPKQPTQPYTLICAHKECSLTIKKKNVQMFKCIPIFFRSNTYLSTFLPIKMYCYKIPLPLKQQIHKALVFIFFIFFWGGGAQKKRQLCVNNVAWDMRKCVEKESRQ